MVTVGLRENLGRIVILDLTVAYFLNRLSLITSRLFMSYVMPSSMLFFTPVLIQL